MGRGFTGMASEFLMVILVLILVVFVILLFFKRMGLI